MRSIHPAEGRFSSKRAAAGLSASLAVLLLLGGCGGVAGSVSPSSPAYTPGSTESAAPSAESSAGMAGRTHAPAIPSSGPAAGETAGTASPSAASAEPPEAAPEEGQPPTALEAAKTVMRALAAGDMKTVAAWTDADEGLRFSPDAHVDEKKDPVFPREETEKLMKDPESRVWGTAAGSGEAIKLKFSDYYKRYVYDADYAAGAETVLNRALGESTARNNLEEVYPPSAYDYVEYHIGGTDPGADGMDWRSLRLVFKKHGEDRALVGIVHDEWTP
ncbi:hypothetical protein [Paenibacillus glufosinatiresistens]|uniref:hypothetical protein n=1 Tax=Paenibacillus glufosinatiresistens TaxID=3070657 RepID=UPI00286E05F6|nr:hypothetical protein [Paenibacillus sp. YX.27]